jgi:hypothetical protein
MALRSIPSYETRSITLSIEKTGVEAGEIERLTIIYCFIRDEIELTVQSPDRNFETQPDLLDRVNELFLKIVS